MFFIFCSERSLSNIIGIFKWFWHVVHDETVRSIPDNLSWRVDEFAGVGCTRNVLFKARVLWRFDVSQPVWLQGGRWLVLEAFLRLVIDVGLEARRCRRRFLVAVGLEARWSWRSFFVDVRLERHFELLLLEPPKMLRLYTTLMQVCIFYCNRHVYSFWTFHNSFLFCKLANRSWRICNSALPDTQTIQIYFLQNFQKVYLIVTFNKFIVNIFSCEVQATPGFLVFGRWLGRWLILDEAHAIFR